MTQLANQFSTPEIVCVDSGLPLPNGVDRESLVAFFHRHMQPYEDTEVDIRRGLDDALGNRPAPGGFIVLARIDRHIAGALVMLRTGMKGYVPENLLLFVAVDRALRGHGIGAQLVRAAVGHSRGDIKLHVEYDNPARRLYERLGFTSKYVEMRLGNHN